MLGHEAAKVYAGAEAAARAEIEALDAWMGELQAELATVEAEREAAGRELAAIYLPSLDPAAIAQVARITGFRGFLQRDPLQAMAREHAKLTAAVQRLDADPEYAGRDGLVGPGGRFVAKLEEARDFYTSWQAECARFESLEGFEELIRIGYDTPAFAERWWEPAYWRHWAAGDRICEALGLADFGDDVLPAWKKVADPRDQWKREADRWDGEVGRIHDLVREHDQAVDRLQRLPEIYLEEARAVLGRHLADADTALLASWAEGSPGNPEALPPDEQRAITLLLKRISGLGAKREALAEMRTRWALPTREQLAGTAATFALKARKYAYGKKALATVTTVPLDFPDKVARIRQRRTKAAEAGRRVVAFTTYERFHLDNDDALWWLLFTDGRPPGAWCPGFHDWYRQHPQVAVREDPEWAEARGSGAATGVKHLDTLGDVS